jgi:hypothetical protein
MTHLATPPDPEGRITYGTCWLVDGEHRLALTAQHLVKGAAEYWLPLSVRISSGTPYAVSDARGTSITNAAD